MRGKSVCEEVEEFLLEAKPGPSGVKNTKKLIRSKDIPKETDDDEE